MIKEYLGGHGSTSPIEESITENTCYLQYADECESKLVKDSSFRISTEEYEPMSKTGGNW